LPILLFQVVSAESNIIPFVKNLQSSLFDTDFNIILYFLYKRSFALFVGADRSLNLIYKVLDTMLNLRVAKKKLK